MLRWSWPAGILTTIYTIIATYVVIDEIRHTGGGWINLRGMGTWLVTAPSQAVLGNLLRGLGIEKVNYADLRAGDYLELIAHVVLSALFIYLVVLGIELLLRRLFSPA
jgi:hypothetical protein